MVQGEQVIEEEDLRALDPLLALYWKTVGLKLQNLRKIVEVVNEWKQLLLIIGLIMLWTF